jgi:hypothetical protein
MHHGHTHTVESDSAPACLSEMSEAFFSSLVQGSRSQGLMPLDPIHEPSGSHSGMAAVLGNRSSVGSNATSAGATSLVRRQKVASGFPPGHIRCPNRRCPNRSCLVMPPAPVAPRERCCRNECETLQSHLVQNAAHPPHAIRHLHEWGRPVAPPRILQADHQQVHACRLHRGSALGERSVGDSETCRQRSQLTAQVSLQPWADFESRNKLDVCEWPV